MGTIPKRRANLIARCLAYHLRLAESGECRLFRFPSGIVRLLSFAAFSFRSVLFGSLLHPGEDLKSPRIRVIGGELRDSEGQLSWNGRLRKRRAARHKC